MPVRKEEIKLGSKTLVFPIPTQEQIPVSFGRKTRHLKGEKLEQEMFWLVLENFLSEEELDAWDSLKGDELEKLPEVLEKVNFLEK